ncbi:MAG: hypothetical protein HND55_03985 [Pseudomonadota bacterium]|nr:MAG: hypothetical protein HND55_03985 [Pseudomonadota bacterium]
MSNTLLTPANSCPVMCGRRSMATCNAVGWSTVSCVFTRDGFAQGLLAFSKPPHRSRLRCDTCHAEHLLAFSCKRRGFCPSCGARRMADGAAWLVDQVFPERPIRQWVLSLPFPLRFLLATHPMLIGRVLGIVYRVIAGHLIRQAGLTQQSARTGAVTLIQRRQWKAGGFPVRERSALGMPSRVIRLGPEPQHSFPHAVCRWGLRGGFAPRHLATLPVGARTDIGPTDATGPHHRSAGRAAAGTRRVTGARYRTARSGRSTRRGGPDPRPGRAFHHLPHCRRPASGSQGMPLMQPAELPHSGLRTDSPARQSDEGIVDLRRVTLTPQADSSGAPVGLASRRPWTAFSALDVDRATPARRRLVTNAERQAECGNSTGCISVAPDPADLR